MRSDPSNPAIEAQKLWTRQQIVTQQVTAEVVEQVVNQKRKQTLENIVNKMNSKLGGLSYIPHVKLEKGAKPADQKLIDEWAKHMDTGNLLIIGLDVSHPTGKVVAIHTLEKIKSHLSQIDCEKDKHNKLMPQTIGISSLLVKMMAKIKNFMIFLVNKLN